ncbi:transporter substrate-binding domain-containing protein [Aureimonas frigidaquae]|uniref:Periplasmic component of amino acid ABC-type transporter/signal transduction system n=1 Tax=Aureimonas frigidaquae TaxID=424757 RepID=A0A0P0Z215_9HYPH|nr:transporter substrate-binding domain-containing protein [Aureimonas frigidaquae]BAT28029.1 periplasmic component of amino acid ABC-type transporter/signal transduction system precursor [Aureimonas frigidaquae]
MFTSFVRRVGLAVGIAAAALATGTPSKAQTIAEIEQKGRVTIGVLTGIPPYDTVDSSGAPDGFLVDLARLAAKDLGVEVEIVPVNNASRAAALESGRVDFLIAHMTATPERAKIFLMTNPYGAYEMRFVAAKDMPLSSLDDLKGKRVSVPKGSTQDVAVSGYGVEGLEVVRFDDDALAMQALISGQVDATAAVATVANDVIAKRSLDNLEVKSDVPIFTLYWSMAVRKNATELHQWLNNFIYYQEVTGALNRLHEKWVGVPIPGGKLPTF